MTKNAQVTLFVIIGAVFLSLIGLFLFYNSQNQMRDTESFAKQQYFNAQQTQLDTFIYECVRQTTIDAEMKVGISEDVSGPLIKQYLLDNLPVCFDDFKEFKRQDYKVETGDLKVKVRIVPEQLIAEITYPITAVKGDSEMRFSYRYYEFPRIVMEPLNENGPTTVVSADGSLILEIPEGTVATLYGEKIDKVGFKILDKNFNGLSNSVLAGMLAFEGLPHGIKFSKPVTIKKYYDEKDIPSGIKEEDLSFGYYEEESGIWYSLQTTVDSEKNKLEIETNHFSYQGVLLECTKGKEFTHTTPNLITERCTCDENWKSLSSMSDCSNTQYIIWHSDEGISTDLCADNDNGCGSACTPFETNNNPENPAEKMCGSSSQGCDITDLVDHNMCGCQNNEVGEQIPCLNEYFGYTELPKGEYKDYIISFNSKGDTCLASTGTDITSIKVTKKAICSTDMCMFGAISEIPIELEGDTPTFKFNLLSIDYNKNGCYPAYAEITFSGIGVNVPNSFYTCSPEEEGKEKEVQDISNSKPGNLRKAKCTCEGTDPNKKCYWKYSTPLGGGGGGGGGGGEGAACDGDEDCTAPMICHGEKCTNPGQGGSEDEPNCEGADAEATRYDPCPGIDEDNYKGATFKIKSGEIMDSRNLKFCDIGDLSDSSIEYTILSSAYRQGVCYLMVDDGSNEIYVFKNQVDTKTTLETACKSVPEPKNLASDEQTYNSINLKWDPVSVAEFYLVYMNDTNIVNTTNATLNVSGLEPSIGYVFNVKAFNSTFCVNMSNASNTINVSTLENPFPPTILDFFKDDVTETSIFMNWTLEGSYTSSKLVRDGTIVYEGPNKFFNDTGLEKDMEYLYELYVYNGELFSNQNKTFNTTIDFIKIMSLTVTEITGESISLVWETKGLYDHSDLYRDSNMIYSGEAKEYEDTGLSPGTEYTYELYIVYTPTKFNTKIEKFTTNP